MRLFYVDTVVGTTLRFSNTFFLSSKSPFFIRITRLIVYFILLHQSLSCRRLFGDLNQFNVFLSICLKFVLIYPMVFLLLHTHLVQWLLWLNWAVCVELIYIFWHNFLFSFDDANFRFLLDVTNESSEIYENAFSVSEEWSLILQDMFL